MRRALGLLAGAGVAAAGALILGEYDLSTATAVVAGVLFGVVVAEVVVAAGKAHDVATGFATGVLTSGGLLWSRWIASGRDWHYVRGAGWLSVAVGAVAAAAAVVRSSGSRGTHTPSSS